MKDITPLKRCIQLLAEKGVTNTNEIAKFVNVTPQAVNRAKREMERTLKFVFEPISSVIEPTSSQTNLEVPSRAEAPTRTRANSNPYGVSSYEDNISKKTNTKKDRAKPLKMVEDGWRPEPNQFKKLCDRFNLSENELNQYIDETFINQCKALGKRYADHSRALFNWLKNKEEKSNSTNGQYKTEKRKEST